MRGFPRVWGVVFTRVFFVGFDGLFCFVLIAVALLLERLTGGWLYRARVLFVAKKAYGAARVQRGKK